MMDKLDSVKEVFNLLEKELKDNFQPRKARVRTYRIVIEDLLKQIEREINRRW